MRASRSEASAVVARLSPVSNLVRELVAILDALARAGVDVAAIGGLAVVAHGVVRATEDLDFLVDHGAREALDRCMRGEGFRALHVSDDAANYVRDALRVDFLFASRPISRQLLAGARTMKVLDQPLRVVDPEGIIGLKVQAIANDPRRAQDVSDIREILRIHRGRVDLERVRSYFRLFDRGADLEQMLAELDAEDDA